MKPLEKLVDSPDEDQLVVLNDLQRFDHQLLKPPQRNRIEMETRSNVNVSSPFRLLGQ